jgi:hypothetical protein
MGSWHDSRAAPSGRSSARKATAEGKLPPPGIRHPVGYSPNLDTRKERVQQATGRHALAVRSAGASQGAAPAPATRRADRRATGPPVAASAQGIPARPQPVARAPARPTVSGGWVARHQPRPTLLLGDVGGATSSRRRLARRERRSVTWWAPRGSGADRAIGSSVATGAGRRTQTWTVLPQRPSFVRGRGRGRR